MGVRLLGYLLEALEDLVGGRGAFHRLAIWVGDWLFERRGVSALMLAVVSGASLCLG